VHFFAAFWRWGAVRQFPILRTSLVTADVELLSARRQGVVAGFLLWNSRLACFFYCALSGNNYRQIRVCFVAAFVLCFVGLSDGAEIGGLTNRWGDLWVGLRCRMSTVPWGSRVKKNWGTENGPVALTA